VEYFKSNAKGKRQKAESRKQKAEREGQGKKEKGKNDAMSKNKSHLFF